jgi:2-dehydro-3-deoxygluconokinase
MIATLGEGLLEVGIPGPRNGDLELGFGGDAANVAVMVARMGGAATLLTRVGEDAVGALLLDFWRGEGIDLSAVSVDSDAPTGIYTNELGPAGVHRFGYYRSGSAASRIDPEAVRDRLQGIGTLHFTGITLAISSSAAEAARAARAALRRAGGRVSFDFNFRPQLGPAAGELLAAAREADVVFLADDDARALLGRTDPEGILEALGPQPREVLVTHGEKEAVLMTADRSYTVKPPPVQIANTAGAGDAFAGAYLASRAGGEAPVASFARAVAAASLSCERSGCARGYPTAGEVERVAKGLEGQVRAGPGIEALTAR